MTHLISNTHSEVLSLHPCSTLPGHSWRIFIQSKLGPWSGSFWWILDPFVSLLFVTILKSDSLYLLIMGPSAGQMLSKRSDSGIWWFSLFNESHFMLKAQVHVALHFLFCWFYQGRYQEVVGKQLFPSLDTQKSPNTVVPNSIRWITYPFDHLILFLFLYF